jgi:hypothetical protein
MSFEFTYAQMSVLRELIKEEQYRIWLNRYLPNMREDCTTEDLQKAFDTLIKNQRNQWTREGVMGTILDMFDEYELEAQKALNMRTGIT